MGLRSPASAPPKNMALIPGGTFLMGSNDFYPEERPVHAVHVEGFWMDERPVTNAEFRRFVKATGYVTVAERPLVPGKRHPVLSRVRRLRRRDRREGAGVLEEEAGNRHPQHGGVHEGPLRRRRDEG